MKHRKVCALILALSMVAVAALASGPTLSLSSWDLGRHIYLVTASASGGTAPYTYEWSVDGGPFEEGFQNKGIYCLVFDSLTGRVIDDTGAVSNTATFDCP